MVMFLLAFIEQPNLLGPPEGVGRTSDAPVRSVRFHSPMHTRSAIDRTKSIILFREGGYVHIVETNCSTEPKTVGNKPFLMPQTGAVVGSQIARVICYTSVFTAHVLVLTTKT